MSKNIPAQKTLIIGPSWVGDMVMAQSLFKLLKQRHPDRQIDVLAPAWTHGLLNRMPEVTQALSSPFQHKQLKLRQRKALGHALKPQAYDQAIVLPNSFKSALVPYWADIPVRTGWQGEWPRRFLLNDMRILDKEALPLMIERFMALGVPAGEPLPQPYFKPSFEISSDDLVDALEKHHLSVPQRPMLALAPGAEFGPSKRWPANYYAEVANAKLREGWDVWLFGSPKDKHIASQIMAQASGTITDLTGKTSLEEGIDLLSLATVVISNDSGLMHIAAALNKPMVAVYGSTSPRFTPPLSDQVDVVMEKLTCMPCFKRVCPLGHWRCMLDLKPEKVLKHLDKVVA
ncbi:MAG: rfaF [Gammaproteobacteria bacterium]|jgi:heptosyltransferase-2|nr:rfaF [Gammaproteobacteria bacterium]